ncbi:acyl-CoA thioesterase [Nodosilinea sp. LEGE 06152]|uniref:acyl-CoA thioesterase n=1 Tax=Nodosilinea sp. LEGE 06152 TaxID=2777966 RepID=UPI001881F76C|nr:thioesterase family protein [Nodosilinea sp. LEGE 06152]MBE9160563.1 acyl-CoA thioesterase [Nodosilinea sp. LEGE 06152]
MGYVVEHQVRFHETDGAGVVYFANELVICHTAYEASLAAAGIDLGAFFRAEAIAYPIAHASIDYRRPLHCSDRVTIHLAPARLDDSSFEIQYQLKLEETLAAQAMTRHVCISVANRRRRSLPAEMEQWLTRWSDPPSQDGDAQDKEGQ